MLLFPFVVTIVALHVLFVGVGTGHGMSIEIRGLLARVHSLSPLCGFWGSNKGQEAWWQVSLPIDPSHYPPLYYFIISLLTVLDLQSWTTFVQPSPAGSFFDIFHWCHEVTTVNGPALTDTLLKSTLDSHFLSFHSFCLSQNAIPNPTGCSVVTFSQASLAQESLSYLLVSHDLDREAWLALFMVLELFWCHSCD